MLATAIFWLTRVPNSRLSGVTPGDHSTKAFPSRERFYALRSTSHASLVWQTVAEVGVI